MARVGGHKTGLEAQLVRPQGRGHAAPVQGRSARRRPLAGY
jgi:hypothetical protein